MTKVIALSGLGNTQKSSLIHGHEDEAGIADILKAKGLSVKILNEVARSCYDILDDTSISDRDKMYKFQETIHLKETERIKEAIKEKEMLLYDVIITDRTWLDNILYANQNAIWNTMKKPEFLQEDPGEDFYDNIILLTHPTKDSMKKEFDIYGEERFRRRFDRVIRGYYGDKVKTFKNGIEDRDKIMDFIVGLLIQPQ